MRKSSILILFLFIGIQCTFGQNTFENLKKHVYTIADDSFMGRIAGSEGAAKAADYIANEFAEMGVRPFLDTTYFQNFIFSRFNLKCKNVIAIIDGYDPELKNEYIVVGAHYDHIGSRNNNDGTVTVYNGADDNASGVAAIIEIARKLRETPTARSVIFMAFDAEEQGLVGSKHFVNGKLIPKEQIKVMFSVDMVGGLKYGKQLEYCGTAYLKGTNDIFNVPNPDNLPLKITPKSNNPFVGTDSDSFVNGGIPGIYVNTGLKTPYHKPEDDPEIIDYEGLEQVTNHLYSVVLSAAGEAPMQAIENFEKVALGRSKVRFGANLGLGANHLEYTGGPVKGKGGFAGNLGLYANIPIFKTFGIQPEVKYERRYAQEYGGTFFTDAVSVPLNLTISLAEPNDFFKVQLGGYYDYIFNGKFEGKKMEFGKDAFNQHEFGITYGFSFKVMKYSLGFVGKSALTDVLSNKVENLPAKRNSAFFVTLGYQF